MKKLLILSLVTIISMTGFSQSPNGRKTDPQPPVRSGGFSITGKVSGFTDSTKLYLAIVEHDAPTPIDSTLVIGGRFHFKGVLASGVQQVILHTFHFTDYKYLWLENVPVTFTGEKGKLREAVITGSRTQDEQQQLDKAVTSGGNEKTADMEFIRRHPNSLVSASILNIYASTWGKDTASLFYNMLSDGMKQTAYGKNVLEFIQLNKDIKVGERYVDFTQPDTSGKDVSVSDFKGKVLLLDFWGSWCVPCRANNPELVKIYHEFKDKGFDVLGVAADEDRKYWMGAIRYDRLPWKNVSDLRGTKNKAVLMYGIYKYPSSYLIDRDGIIIAQDLRGDELRARLREALK